MGYYLRHAAAVLVFPVTVAVVVPFWIWRRGSMSWAPPSGAVEWASMSFGAAALVVGAVLFVWSLRGFGVTGRGTLAPWDPPIVLVVDGPYAYVRNPMISGVALILVAEAAVLGSLPHLGWAAAFTLVNAVYIPLLEEPGLRARFGPDYEAYSSNVPRLIPRLSPWRGNRRGESRA